MMLTNKINVQFLFQILALILAAPPPNQDLDELHLLYPIKYNPFSPTPIPFIPTQTEEAEMPPYQFENATLYHENYRTKDHQIIIGGNIYSERNEIGGVELLINTEYFYDLIVTFSCDVIKKNKR